MLKPLLAATLLAGGLSVTATPAYAVEPRTCVETPVVAHRGLTENGITENTLRSTRAATRAKAWFEVDVRETADDRVVLMHDQSISRTTNGSGQVATMTARKIRTFETNDGHVVPFVGAILRDVQANPEAHVILDLKALDLAGHREMRDKINEYDIVEQVEAISFHEEQLADFRRLNPDVTAYHIEGRSLPSIATARANGGAHVFPQIITQRWADKMVAAGIPYNGRIDDTTAGHDAALEYAVRNIMSDDVSGYRTYCGTSVV